jgi:hypothetical protein
MKEGFRAPAESSVGDHFLGFLLRGLFLEDALFNSTIQIPLHFI